MKDKTYLTVLLLAVCLCAALTLAHLFYAAYLYQHASIIEFIAGEMW